MTVDEFVERQVLPQFRPVVAAIRNLMKECAPDAREVISYGASRVHPNQPALRYYIKQAPKLDNR